MALSIIEEKDKIIGALKDHIKNQDPKDNILAIQDDLPVLSPENSQYPESNSGGDSSILNSHRLAFETIRKLNEICEDDSLHLPSVSKTQNQADKMAKKKSYTLENDNPYRQKSRTTTIKTNNPILNETIAKIEQDIQRKRKASEMEEFCDFGDTEEVKDLSYSGNEVSEGKASIPKSQIAIHDSKRSKKFENSDNKVVDSKTKKKINVTRQEGWVIKDNKSNKSKKGRDWADALEDSKEIKNDHSFQFETVEVENKKNKKKSKKAKSKPKKKGKAIKNKQIKKQEGVDEEGKS